MQEQSTAALENKHNLAQREQYYASARKAPPSPAAPDFTALDRIPEYAEDIYPYATFHVPTDAEGPTATKLQTFGFREGTLTSCESSAVATSVRKHNKGEFQRTKRSRDKGRGERRDSEDYDSFASESDTEQGTSSRTESSNQLEESVPVQQGVPNTVAPGATHHNLLYPGPESSTSPEPSPVAERRSFPRLGKPSRRGAAPRPGRPPPPLQTEVIAPGSEGPELSEAECDVDKCSHRTSQFLAVANKDFSIRV